MIEQASLEMTKISGQKSIITKSKKDIANFKLRKGMPIGVKVTLRRNRMYEFLDRLISISMPESGTFKESIQKDLMVGVIIPLELKSR